jgi:CRP-like cAMP-binding protein
MPHSPEHILALLGSADPFGALPGAALRRLVAQGRLVRYARDQVIYRRGDAGDSLMVLLSGSVKISNVTASGREIVLAFIREGAINGEIAAFDGKERTANAVALEHTDALVIARRDVLPVFAAHPEAMLRLVAVISERLRASNAALEAHSLHVAARTASGLLRLAQQHGCRKAGSIALQIRVTQRDLASYVGLSREKINRALGEFRAAGLVRIEQTAIIILKHDGLDAVANAIDC